MDINTIITELKERRLISELREVAPEHLILRREEEFIKNIPEFPNRTPMDDFPNPNRGTGSEDEVGVIYRPNENEVDSPEYDRKRIRAKIETDGMDALAWYRSFHWTPTDKWGIYVTTSGIYYIADEVFKKAPQITAQNLYFDNLDYLRESYRFLFLHEFFHFITDIAAVSLEMGSPTIVKSKYEIYTAQVYEKPTQDYQPIEEALANAFTYHRFYGEKLRNQISIFMDDQPRGYNSFRRFLWGNFRKGRRELGTSLTQGSASHSIAPMEILFDCQYENLSFSDVPVYLVNDMKNPKYGISFVNSIKLSELVETSTFSQDFIDLPENIKEKYQKQRNKFQSLSRGLNFEKLKGWNNIYTMRIDNNYRLSLRPINGKWELLRIGNHDDIYRKPIY